MELKSFHDIKLDTEILCLEAMPLSVSPLFTVYVDCEFDDEDELELELDELLELLLVLITWFGKMMSPDKSFQDFKLETDVLCFCAMVHRESPLFTV